MFRAIAIIRVLVLSTVQHGCRENSVTNIRHPALDAPRPPPPRRRVELLSAVNTSHHETAFDAVMIIL